MLRAAPGFSGLVLVILCSLALATPALQGADKEKKPEPKPAPPRLLVTLPLAITAGSTQRVRVRGQGLDEVTEITFTNAPPALACRLLTQGKAEVPRDQDAKQVGDSQIELEILCPPETPAGIYPLRARSPHGASAGHALLVLAPGTLLEEQEPNGGISRAQPLAPGRILQGTVREDADVDVFRIEGRPGQWLIAEVRAARLGSALDPVLTLLGPRGEILAENDDGAGGRDARLRFQIPAGQTHCFLSLTDAHHRGGPALPYLLEVKPE